VDKPEVKKAGGVYYTPTYIVDYIVNRRWQAPGGRTCSIPIRQSLPSSTARSVFDRLRLRLLPPRRLSSAPRLVPTLL
jgi:hypothetical protein